MTLRTLHIFKDVQNAGCATCGASWIGRTADDDARAHALATLHQVTITVNIRETHNAPESDFRMSVPAPTLKAPEPVARGRAAYAGVDIREHGALQGRFHGEDEQ